MESKQFNELNDILTLVQESLKAVHEALNDDGKISLMEWVGLVWDEASDAIHVATNAKDVISNEMSKEEIMALLEKVVEIGKEISAFFVKNK
jgi:hypothetical protein